jgi:tetratricopeptide (TPR) repeat protein
MLSLGDLRMDQRRFDEAQALLEKCHDTRRTVLGEGHPETLVALQKLGRVFELQGRHGDAEPHYAELVRLRKASLPPGHSEIAAALRLHGECLAKLGRQEEAESALREASAPTEPPDANTNR